MPRRRPERRGPSELAAPALAPRIEAGPDGDEYVVRSVPGARATKTYRCPGCDQEIRSGTAHVVVWRFDDPGGGADDRRHWHTPCWANRSNRGPTRKR